MDLIIYCDNFQPNNSNYYWKKKLEKYTDQLIAIKINPNIGFIRESFLKKYKENPNAKCMLHLGGSVKYDHVFPIEQLRSLKNEFPNLRLTSHYGDIYQNDYIYTLGTFFDAIHVTNASNIKSSSMYFCPHPIDLDWYNSNIEAKKYDIAFAGNTYLDKRVQFLQKLVNEFKDKSFIVIGKGWDKYQLPKNVTLTGQLSIEQTIKYYQESKLVLDDPIGYYCKYNNVNKCCSLGNKFYQKPICTNHSCEDLTLTDKWFSSRPLHMLLSKTPAIMTNRYGQKSVIPYAKYASNFDEFCSSIGWVFNNMDQAVILANQGYEQVQEFSFERCIEKLVNHRIN